MLSLRIDGRDVLRPASDDADDPLETACFPLLPYANRIARGRFAFGGATHRLPLNFGDHPHSIHGIGWRARWQVEALGPDHAVLVHAHEGGPGWPWPYRAEQHLRLTERTAVLALSLRNLSEEAVPAGLGFHPYFAADAGTRLHFAARSVWLATHDLLPDREGPADRFGDWREGAPVLGGAPIDNCFAGWDGRAAIAHDDGQRFLLTARGADHLHLYRPPGECFFCLEPVTHMPDAINRPGGMALLAPGAARTLVMEIASERS